MIELTVHVPITSQDLQELADQARRLEQSSKFGEDLTIRIWSVQSTAGLSTTLRFIIDQSRARNKGLMK